MNKLENHIFYTICDKSFQLFKLSNYLSFHSFCNGLNVAMKLHLKERKAQRNITQIVTYVALVYGLEFTETLEYLIDFLDGQKYFEYQESVMLVHEYFKNSFN